jgi:hypothetical protein
LLLTEPVYKAVDEVVEISVALPEVLNLADGVNNGRMMLAAETFPNLWQRGVRE